VLLIPPLVPDVSPQPDQSLLSRRRSPPSGLGERSLGFWSCRPPLLLTHIDSCLRKKYLFRSEHSGMKSFSLLTTRPVRNPQGTPFYGPFEWPFSPLSPFKVLKTRRIRGFFPISNHHPFSLRNSEVFPMEIFSFPPQVLCLPDIGSPTPLVFQMSSVGIFLK